MIRIAVMYGQVAALSPGMMMLARRLEEFGPVTTFTWGDTNNQLEWIRSGLAIDRIALVGFSLGANQIGWLDQLLVSERIDLAIAYDPSRQSPLVRKVGSEYVQTVRRTKRLVCYYNPRTWFYGGSRYEYATNIETITINMPHMLVQFSQSLHARTIEEIEEIERL
jgi:hypothetical protein